MGAAALAFTSGGVRQVSTLPQWMPGGGSVSFYHRMDSNLKYCYWYYGSCDRVQAGEGGASLAPAPVLEMGWQCVARVFYCAVCLCVLCVWPVCCAVCLVFDSLAS